MPDLQTFIFIGRSGCGKGTQVDLLKKHLTNQSSTPILAIETGARFRSFIAETSHSSQLSKTVMESGARQPDFLAIWMWANTLIESFTGSEHLIFDGTPRALPEAKALETALTFYNRLKVVVVHLNLTRAEAQKRLLARGRVDDRTLTEINKRLDWFDDCVSPTIEFYRQHDHYQFVELDGSQAIETVHQELLASF